LSFRKGKILLTFQSDVQNTWVTLIHTQASHQISISLELFQLSYFPNHFFSVP
jgi:hypothetical protein